MKFTPGDSFPSDDVTEESIESADFLVHVLTGVDIDSVVDADHGCQSGDDAPEDKESTACFAVQYRFDA